MEQRGDRLRPAALGEANSPCWSQLQSELVEECDRGVPVGRGGKGTRISCRLCGLLIMIGVGGLFLLWGRLDINHDSFREGLTGLVSLCSLWPTPSAFRGCR